MKSYKDQMNMAARGSSVLKELSPEESAALKSCILGIFKAVKDLCSRQGLTYMLSGGSCLGSVRHKGFIPWDDDLDIMMPRADYQTLLSLLESGELGKDYSFSYPDGKMESPVSFLKVYKNDTVLVGLTDGKDCPYPQKVFLDVFPLDGIPPGAFARKIKGSIADALRFAANTVYDSRPWSEAQKQFFKSRPEMMRTVRGRRFLGKILSVIPHRKWVYWFDRFVNNPSSSGCIGIPTGRKRYGGEIFPAIVYLPTIEGKFEGLTVQLPGGWDVYLRNLYKNYMELPPVEKRERHFIVDISI